MGAIAFGQLVQQGMDALGLSQSAVARRTLKALPVEDDRHLDATQIRLIMFGRHRLDHPLVKALIAALDLNPAEAWAASGLLPPGVTADMLRRLDIFASREPAAAGSGPGALKHRLGKPRARVRGMGRLIPFPADGRAA